MASKIKIKVSQFEGQTICLQPFAYDVCKHSAIKFGAQALLNCKWKGIQNVYEPPDFITVLTRMIFKYQLTQRMTWCCLFYVRYFITKFKSFEDIHDALQIVLKLSREEADGCVFNEVLISLAVVSEIVIFIYNTSAKIHKKNLAAAWTEYFCGIRKKFEEAGGFTEMYKRLSQPKYDSLDIFYSKFIENYCLPIGSPVVNTSLYDNFYKESRSYYEWITKNLSAEEKYEYNAVFTATLFRYSRRVMQADQILQLALPPKIETFAFKIPEWIIRRAPAESGQRIYNSPSTKEDFEQLNLRSLGKTDPGNWILHYPADRKESNRLYFKTSYVQENIHKQTDRGNGPFIKHLLNSWYRHDVIASFMNRSGTGSQFQARGGKGLSGQEELKRKSRSLISMENVNRLLLASSVLEQPGNAEVVIGMENHAEENKLLEEEILRMSFFMNYLLRFDLHNRAADQKECAEIDAKLRERLLFATDIATSSQNRPSTSHLGENRMIRGSFS